MKVATPPSARARALKFPGLVRAGSAFLGLYCAGALGQAVPDAGSLLQQQQRTAPPALKPLPGGEAPAVERPALKAGTGAKVLVRRIKVSGAEGLASAQELEAAMAPALGKEFDFAGLEQLADELTRLLRSRGWLLARAYLPQQDLTAGELEIAVLQGRIEGDARGAGIEVRRAAGVRLSEERVRLTVAGSVFRGQDGTPHVEDLERAVLLLNDLPGVQARSSLGKGGAPNTTRVAIETSEGPLMSGSVWMDNYGNRYTGAIRANVMGSLNDPTGHGDQASLMATDAEGLAMGRASYSLPLGYGGLRAQASVGTLRYKIGKDQAALRSTGGADTYSLGLTYPLLRSRGANVSLSANYDHKALEDRTLGVATRDKRVDSFTFGLSADRYDQWLGGGLTNAMISVTTGRLDLSRVPTDLAADATTARTNGGYAKLAFSLARLQRVGEDTSVFASVSGQWSGRNLDTSEKFFLGGPSAVRAYPTGEASGDRGWVGTLELRHDLPGLRALGLGDVQALGFLDAGQVALQANPFAPPTNASGRNAYSLSGYGAGLNVGSPGRYNVRLAYSRALGLNPGRSAAAGTNSDGVTGLSRVWLFGMISF